MTNELLIVLFLVLTLSQVTMLLYFWLFDRKMKLEMERLLGGGALAESQSQGLGLLRGAMKQSQGMLVEAELEGIKVAAESKLATGKLEERYASEIAVTAEELQKQFTKEVATLSSSLKKYLDELEIYAKDAQLAQQEHSKAQVEKLYLSFEKDLRDTIVAMNKDSLTAVQNEIAKAKEEIAAYQKKRLLEVEKEIVAITSDVVKEILKKEASASGQPEAILAAFEKAKEAHFIQS